MDGWRTLGKKLASSRGAFPIYGFRAHFALAGCKALTILSLGDETARGLGVPVEKVRFL